MKKVISRIYGGLGNQLFCYSAARRFAIANNAQLVLDSISGFIRDHEYQRQYQLNHFNIPHTIAEASKQLEPLSRVQRYTLRAINRWRPAEKRNYIQQNGVDFDTQLFVAKPRNTLYLDGYWQSEDYFKDVESMIRQDLCIIPPSDKENLVMAERIASCNAIAVHVRFFDMPQIPSTNNVNGAYYKRALAKIDILAPNAHYFIFSDQPAYAHSQIHLPPERMTMVTHNSGDEKAYADLWLMTLCQHFIIANSTFSWWGAWLSNSHNKKVIAPDPKLMALNSYWRASKLLPKDWILV